jgi:hypothetical protein
LEKPVRTKNHSLNHLPKTIDLSLGVHDSFEMIAANSTGFGSISRILPYAIAGAWGAMIKQAEVLKAKAIANAGLKK